MQTDLNPSITAVSWGTKELAVVVIVGLLFAAAVFAKMPFVNGFGHFYWPWKDLSTVSVAGWLSPALAPFAAALYLIERDGDGPVWRVLVLLALASLALQLGVLLAHGQGLSRITAIVQSWLATSYFTDAQAIKELSTWLANFPPAVQNLHSMTHPPGPILYYYFWLQFFDPDSAAMCGGLVIGVAAAAVVPALYVFAGLWTSDRRTRLVACALYALIPGVAVFLPEFDQVYPLLSMGMIFAWIKALEGKSWYVFPFAAIVCAAIFFAYHLLVTGLFLALYAPYFLWKREWNGKAWAKLAFVSISALALVLTVYVVIWLGTGFNPAVHLPHALYMQHRLELKLMPRPRLPSLALDPYHFLMGAGMLVLPLLLLGVRDWRRFDAKDRTSALTALVLASLLLFVLSGVLRGETTRVWLFLQPLLIIPAALSLMRFDASQRTCIFALQWFIVVVLASRMAFLSP